MKIIFLLGIISMSTFIACSSLPKSPEVPTRYIPTENIQFTRCTTDGSMYCLTDEQYTILIAQLSAREN